MNTKMITLIAFSVFFILNQNYAQSDTPIYKKVEITINDDADITELPHWSQPC